MNNLDARISRLERTAYVGTADWLDVGKIKTMLIADAASLAGYGPEEPLPVVVLTGNERLDACRQSLLRDNADLQELRADVA